MLLQRLGLPLDEVLSRLQAVAFVTGRTVHELADVVVRGRYDPGHDEVGGA